ncbi:MAG: hypothetical protein IJD00_00975, partial [Clostridia bacterium]|nr:hypothetical protein [Clostridia bacterium]
MKKILSVTLAILLIATSFSMLSLCVSAETLAAGSYPYADKGVKAPVVNTSTTDEVYAADGFRTIVNADALTDEDFYNTFRPHLNKSTTHVVSGKTYMTTSLVDYSETDDNVYGTSGKAVKVAYISGGAGSVTPANETTAQKMHCIRIINNISILGEWKDSAAIGFWVKTEYPVYIAVRLPVNISSTNNCFIVSDKISVPAGESFIEIPLANFKTLGDGFVALNSAGNISISNVDIYFCGQETFTDTRDMYIDNYGYTSGYSGYKAVHDVGFKEITLTTSNWKINSAHAPNTSVSLDTNAAYSHSGYSNVAANTSALKVEYSNINAISDTAGKVRLYYEGKMQLSSTAPYIYGEDSIIAFWVRADQPMSLLINYLDYGTKNETSAQYQTKSLTVDIPVGESIVKIKMSEMAPSGVTFDYRYAYQFMITAKTNNYSIAGKTSGTIYFDAFGFYDESYEPPVVPDTKVTHA